MNLTLRNRRHRLLACLSSVAVCLSIAMGPVHAATAEELPISDTLAGNFLAALSADRHMLASDSAQYYSAALDNDPTNIFLLERTLTTSITAGDIETALHYADRLQDQDPGNRLAALALGVDALRAHNWAVAIENLKKTNDGPLAGLTAEVMSAWAEVGAGNSKAALARLGKLEGEDWFSFFRYYHAGLIAAMTGDDAAASASFASAHKIDNGAIRVIDAYIRSLARLGRVSEAQRLLREAMADAPNHPMLQEVDADRLAGRKPKLTIKTAEQGAAEILSGLGAAIARDDAGRSGDLAAVYLQLALALDPSADLARITLAQYLERAEAYQQAIDILSEVSDSSPLKRNADMLIGFDYNTLDDLPKARAHLQRLVDSDPHDLEAVMALGNVLRVREKFADAAEIYSKGIASLKDLRPAHWQLFYNRGITYERTGQWDKAEADFLQAIKLSPDQPSVLNYLGYSWVDRGEKYEQALAMIQKAVDLDPSDGYVIDSLGWAYFKLGRYEEAVKQLEQAVALKPGDPTLNDHLGDAYWRIGRRLEARFQWNHARDMKPDEKDLPKILEKIKNGLPDEAKPASASTEKPVQQ